MACIFRWVQLSDIHFKVSEEFGTYELKESLLDFLDTLEGPFNAIFFSGDYRFARDSKTSVDNVYAYMDKLIKKLHVDSKSVVMVPGNHDKDRSYTTTATIKQIRQEYEPSNGKIDEEALKNLLGRFEFFEQLKKKVMGTDAEEEISSNPHKVIQFDSVQILALNTAYTGYDSKEDYHNIIVGSSYVQQAIASLSSNKATIVIGHHGFDWWKEEEKNACAKLFEHHNLNLYLCGHAHNSFFSSTGEGIVKQVCVGYLCDTNKRSLEASFSVGELMSDGSVDITFYSYDTREQAWAVDSHRIKRKLTNLPVSPESKSGSPLDEKAKTDESFLLKSYRLLGGLGENGIKYIWEKNGEKIESVAFNSRLKVSDNPVDQTISAYSVSTSLGCVFSSYGKQCNFCQTGTRKYSGDLKADEIALQCIFMAEFDSDCPSYPRLRKNAREFAFMGQGEPGKNYPAIREAIRYTDIAMKSIDQRVSRYIISTIGVTDFIPSLINDIENNIFLNPVTIHFSLGFVGEEARNKIIPIEDDYHYKSFLQECTKLFDVTKEKIGVGLLLFNDYVIRKDPKHSYTLDESELLRILGELDPKIFRIDLCNLNKCSVGENRIPNSNEMANNLLKVVEGAGFEGKVFYSFGDSEKSGCGMLDSSDTEIVKAGEDCMLHYRNAVILLNDAISELKSR